MSALSTKLEFLAVQVDALQSALAGEPTYTWMTLPHVAKLLGAVHNDIIHALDDDPIYSQEHSKARDQAMPVQSRIEATTWAYQWHGETVAVVAFSIEGGSDFDARGLTAHRTDALEADTGDAEDGTDDGANDGAIRRTVAAELERTDEERNTDEEGN